jgi:predicted O-linked N-acetylglucosamine transferase (SPINDLY family)
MTDSADVLSIAIQHHQAGRLPQAEALYRQILEADPAHADALHLFGVIALQRGEDETARQRIAEAIRLKPGQAAYYSNLGETCRRLGRVEEAIVCFQQALQIQPAYPEAHNNLALTLLNQGRPAEAEASCRRALELRPNYVEALVNLAYALHGQARLTEAIACYYRVLALNPDLVDVRNNLGVALVGQDRLEEAVLCYRETLRLRPDLAEVHNNLGVALSQMGKVADAVATFRQALRLRPESADAHNNLGLALKDQGLMEQALLSFREAVRLQPANPLYHNNLVYALPFSPDYDTAAIVAEMRRWDQQHAAPLASSLPAPGIHRDPARRLRVGYVSPHFGLQPVGLFMLPLLEAHDHARFEIFCYSSVRVPDWITDRCRAHADVWRDVLGHGDEQLAQVIRDDRIEILMDLTMHMEGCRLLAFARKPAPVQVTYLAYPGSTGLAAMDYRLTDPYLDPPGGPDEGIYVEQSLRLAETYWCYRPPIEAPPVASLPALRAGHITFGCLNNFCKVSESALLAWIRLLQALPDTRLFLHARAGDHRQRVQELLAKHQLTPDRLGFVDSMTLEDYYRYHERIDIALDPFPHAGGTTTCDALWMGVPVITLAGKTVAGRGGVSILSNIGLTELVASDVDDYLRKARALAGDLPRLSELRTGLRERMRNSPLMNVPRFARNVEAAYREIWERFCSRPG